MDEPVEAPARDPRGPAAWLRRWPYLAGGVLLFLIGQWIESVGGWAGLGRLALGAAEDLGLFSPLVAIPTFLDHLAACHAQHDLRGAFVREVCNYGNLANPLAYPKALLLTLATLWDQSGPGRLLLPAILIAAVPVASRAVLALEQRTLGGTGEYNVANVALIALVVPFVGSLLALVFKWLAIGLLTVFGQTVGALVVLAGTFALVWQSIEAVRRIRAHADTLERLHDRLTRAGDPPPPQRPPGDGAP